MSDKIIPIANESEHTSALFLMSAGAYGDTCCYVWANSFDDAFEVFVEWLDDNAPGMLVSHEAMREIYESAAKALGIDWDTAVAEQDDSAISKVCELAEADLTIIGHTTLKHGGAIASYEWNGGEASPEEIKDVKVRSVEACLKADLPTIANLLMDISADCEPEGGATIDARLTLTSDGTNWDILVGDVSYDARHEAFCGEACVSFADGKRECEETALDLIGQVCDQLAESL